MFESAVIYQTLLHVCYNTTDSSCTFTSLLVWTETILDYCCLLLQVYVDVSFSINSINGPGSVFKDIFVSLVSLLIIGLSSATAYS